MISKILVTGSEGSLMTEVIKVLGTDYEILGVDVKPKKTNEYPFYQFVQADLCDAKVVDTIIRTFKPNIIIQAAAKIYGVGGFNKHCASILGDDITLHRNVLDAAVKHGVDKVVFTSSSMVYERATKHSPVNEEDVYDYGIPLTDYGLSKLTNERLSEAYWTQYGLKYTIWRPFNIITPYEDASDSLGDSHVFADFIQSLVVEKKDVLPILGDGEQVRCFTWIDEVAEVIAHNITNPDTDNQVFNIGRDQPISMKDLAVLIRATAMDLNIIEKYDFDFDHLSAYQNDVLYRVPDVSKVKEFLKWQANISVEKSVENILKMKFCREYKK